MAETQFVEWVLRGHHTQAVAGPLLLQTQACLFVDPAVGQMEVVFASLY
jgi:hypothetical protein